MYKIGSQFIEIPYKVVNKIIEWNEEPKRKDVIYDRKICHLFVMSLSSKENVCQSKICDEVITFIKGDNRKLIYIFCSSFT